MGMTFTTLHLWGIGREALLPRLEPGDLLREQNAPWLGVVPDEEACGDLGRLEKLGKLLTKENETAAALLFYYFDDDLFQCRLIQGGKKTAECRSGGSWAKLGKKLNELFGDEAPAKALRYLSRCSDLQEQIALLEETVGAALYDVSVEEQPRLVPRSDTTLREIKARESALRRRPKQFMLTELPREDWPEDMKTRQSLLERLRPVWWEYDVSELLYSLGWSDDGQSIPQHPERMFLDDKSRWRGAKHLEPRGLLYDRISDSVIKPRLPAASRLRPLWQTGEDVVWLVFGLNPDLPKERVWVREKGMGCVVCLSPEGEERWHFSPCSEGTWNLLHAHTSPEGILTLYLAHKTQGKHIYPARIWRVDGKTGEILYHRVLPETEELHKLLYVEALDAFVYALKETKELVLLDAGLREIARWGGYEGDTYFYDKEKLCGCLLIEQRYWDLRSVYFHDLRDGSITRTPLEIRSYVCTALPDGRILGVNEKQNSLIVFDREGQVAARCTVPGMLRALRVEADRVCLVELRGDDPFGLICRESVAASHFHVWRLDPVK